MRRRSLFVAALLASATFVAAQAAPSSSYAVGQAIQVREGDTWSNAKVTSHEGRRYQIQYDDGTQEWVTSERIRAGGASTGSDAAKPDASPTTDAPKPADAAPAGPPSRSFTIGKSVEVKRGAFWKQGTIKLRRNDWYLVNYEGGHFSEWAEPWRVRAFGSSYDLDGSAPSNPMMIGEKIDAPPTERPGPAPAGGDEAAMPGEPVAASSGEAISIAPVVGVPREAIPAIAPWAYKPAPVAPSHASDRPIGIQSSGDFFENSAGLDVSGSLAMVSLANDAKRSPPAAVIVNLGTGEQVVRATFDPTSVPAAMSADGKRVFCKSDGKVKTRVDVWDIGGGGRPRHVVSFAPYAADFFKDVTSVIALDATHVLTNNFGKHVIVFAIGDGVARAVWQMKLEGGTSDPFVSPDRKALAILWNGNLMLVDAATGNAVGTIETSARAATSLSFRGDGKRLAMLDGPTLYEFDLEAGTQRASLGLPKAIAATSVQHLADANVFLAGFTPGEPVVLDVDQHAIVARYKLENAQATTVAGDRLLASIKSDKRRALCAWLIPGKPAKPSVPLALLPTGTSTRVAIDVQLEADDATKKAIDQALRQQVAARGWSVVQNGAPADVTLVGRTENGASSEQTYTDGPSFGPFARDGHKVTVTQKITRLSIDVGGKIAWQTSSMVMPGFMVMRKRDQTVEQAVADADQFNLDFLKSVTLPETIFQPIDGVPATVASYALVSGGIRAD